MTAINVLTAIDPIEKLLAAAKSLGQMQEADASTMAADLLDGLADRARDLACHLRERPA